MRKRRAELMEKMKGDPLGLSMDPEMRITLLDVALKRAIQNKDDEELNNWKEMVQYELDTLPQHDACGTRHQVDAHIHLYNLLK